MSENTSGSGVPSPDHKMADAAKAYRARGWRPIRLHGLREDGLTCTCKRGVECGGSSAKHPTDDGWQNAEPMTDGEIDAAWGGWRAGHNVGIATGGPGGFFVLDVDPDNGGTESIRQLQNDYKPLEAAAAQVTGSGGWHLLFAMPPDFDVTNRRGQLKGYPGLDIRGTGGQIVAAPSSTPKGTYRWLSEGEPEQAPAWLLELLRPKAAPKAPAVAPAPAVERPSYDDAETDRLERYSATVRDLEVGRLVAMKEAAGPSYTGEPWNTTTFSVACALLELANSPWTLYDHEQAYLDLWHNAPRDEGFTDEDVNGRWESAKTTVGENARPFPVARPDAVAEVTSWASEPGVRIDPILLQGRKAPPGVIVEADPDDRAPAHIPQRTWDDLGNAKRMVDHFGRRLRWVAQPAQWAVFRSGRWELVAPNVVQGMVQEMFDELIPATEALHYPDVADEDDDSERDKFIKWLKAQRMSARIAAAQKEAQGRPELQADVMQFDQAPMLFNVANGVVDLATGDLLPHSPELMLMRQSPVEYDPAATAPLWAAFLDRVMPDPEMQAYLQRISGYSMTGNVTEQAFFIHHGDGANGKSIWSAITSAVLSGYGQVVAPSTLLANTQDEHPTGVAMMMGKRWLPATETAPGRRLDEEKVKNLTGNEPVTARFMGKDFFEFLMTGKLHLITNHLPFLSDAHSIWRRIHLIQWGVTIPEAEQDRQLEQKLRGELPGILLWFVRGAKAWAEQGLNAPAAALQDLAVYRGDSDSFGDFLRECTLPSPDAQTPVGQLYDKYVAWALRQGMRRPMTQPSFVAVMVERKFKRYRDSRSRGFVGIVPVASQLTTADLPW